MMEVISSKRLPAESGMPLLARLRRDRRGVTAIEFAMVAGPFLMLLYGILGVGLYFFTVFTVENAVEQASRIIRTGQAQSANMNAAAFKTELCNHMPGHIDCVGKVRVNVRTYGDAEDITAASLPQCLDGGNLSNTTVYNPGAASTIVMVWICYEWEFAKNVPFLNLADMGNGSRLIQASTVFRTEPYQ